MAFDVGSISEFTDASAVMDPVVLVAAKEVKLPALVGVFYNALSAPQVPFTQKVFEIYSRSNTSLDGVIGSSNWDNDDTTGLSVSADAANGLTVGHVIKVGSEIVVVKSVNRTNNTIEVFSRGFGGTTAASHTAGDAFKMIGSAGRDIDLENVESFNEKTGVYKNCIQTVFETIDWEKSDEYVRKGIDPKIEHLLTRAEAMTRVARKLARMSILGVKNIPTNKNIPYASAGLLQQLTDTASGARSVLTYDISSSASGVFSEDVLKYALDKVQERGNADKILCSQAVKKYFDALVSANAAVQMTTDMTTRRAGYSVNQYEYNGVVYDIMVDADMPDDQIAILNLAKCRKGWLENDLLKLTKQPTNSDRVSREAYQGSLGFAVEDVGSEHILIKGISSGNTTRTVKVAVTGTSNVKITNASTDPVPTQEITAG